MRHGMVGRDECQPIALADFLIQHIEEISQIAVQPKVSIFYLDAVRSEVMTDIIR